MDECRNCWDDNFEFFIVHSVSLLADFIKLLSKLIGGSNGLFVAAPILDPTGQPVAALTVAGPAYRLLREQLTEIGPIVVATAREIAQGLSLQ